MLPEAVPHLMRPPQHWPMHEDGIGHLLAEAVQGSERVPLRGLGISGPEILSLGTWASTQHGIYRTGAMSTSKEHGVYRISGLDSGWATVGRQF